MTLELIATAASGTEAVVKRELATLTALVARTRGAAGAGAGA